MPKIFDLPNEILIEIINLITPEGIEQLTLSCKEIYNVGRDALKMHNRYRKPVRLRQLLHRLASRILSSSPTFGRNCPG